MSELKLQLVSEIKERFQEQGGTGYESKIEFDGVRCAVGVMCGPGHSLDFRGIVRGRGLAFVDADELAFAHDDEIQTCFAESVDGVSTLRDYHRALFGTPAYERVIGRLERWAAEDDELASVGAR